MLGTVGPSAGARQKKPLAARVLGQGRRAWAFFPPRAATRGAEDRLALPGPFAPRQRLPCYCAQSQSVSLCREHGKVITVAMNLRM
jgi:hypothetical protein